MKAHPMVGDSLLAGLLAVVDTLFFVGRSVSPEPDPTLHPWWITFPLIIGTVAPLVFRRRHPVLVAYLVLLFSIPHSLLNLGVASLVGNCVSLYTLVAYVGRRPALLFLAANVIDSAVQVFVLAKSGSDVLAMVIPGVLAF